MPSVQSFIVNMTLPALILGLTGCATPNSSTDLKSCQTYAHRHCHSVSGMTVCNTIPLKFTK